VRGLLPLGLRGPLGLQGLRGLRGLRAPRPPRPAPPCITHVRLQWRDPCGTWALQSSKDTRRSRMVVGGCSAWPGNEQQQAHVNASDAGKGQGP
jgi:hypothetical protein